MLQSGIMRMMISPAILVHKEDEVMKKLLFFALCTAAFMSVSCSKELSDEIKIKQVVRSFTAQFVETKTSIDGLKTKWVKGDKVALWDQVSINVLTASESGDVTILTGLANEESTSFAAIYPYSDKVYIYETNLKVLTSWACPCVNTVADGSQLPLIATFSDSGTFDFQPAAAVLKFTISDADDGRYKSISISGNNAESGICGRVNFNLETGNVSQWAGYEEDTKVVSYAPTSGSIAAGTYYIGIYTPNGKTTRTFSKGITISFITTDDQKTTVTSSASLTVTKGHIADFGTLHPVAPEPKPEFGPYEYPTVSKITPVGNIMRMNGSNATVTNATDDAPNKIATINALSPYSVGNATISVVGNAGTFTLAGNTTDSRYNTYVTTKAWQENDYVLFSSTLPNAVSGDLAFTFNISCGTAKNFAGTWTAQWSIDGGTIWSSDAKVYNYANCTEALATAAGNTFVANQTNSYYDGVTTMVFNPGALAAGSTIYIKVTNGANAKDQSKTLRVNQGFCLYQFPADTDFSGDADIILSENFSNCRSFGCDVIGTPIGMSMNINAAANFPFNREGWGVVGTTVRKLGHVYLGKTGVTDNAVITPALCKISGTQDIVVTFKASPILFKDVLHAPAVTVSVAEGDGVAETTFWTKPLSDSTFEWTVGYCRIKGASASTKVKIGFSESGSHCCLDDIVITPVK